MAGQLTHYDILDVLPGASASDIQLGYETRSRILRPELISGAPSKVIAAADRALMALETARLVLSEPGSRLRYDGEVGIRRTDGGLQRPVLLSSGTGWAVRLAQRRASRRHVTVPDARGLFVSTARHLLAASGLRAEFVQLTRSPMPVEGLIIDQVPEPGTRARQPGTITLQVWHPPAH